MSEAEYLADPCDTPSLSSSIAHLLVSRSPRHAWRAHPRLGNVDRAATEAQDRGSVIHALVLGKGASFAVLDVDDFRTKDARAQREAAVADGRIPIKRDFYHECEGVALVVTSTLDKLGIRLVGERQRTELVAIWQEDGAMCRARFDSLDGATIYDLKTTREGTDQAIERSIRQYGYHIQAAAYVSALEHLGPELAGRVSFVPIFVECDTNEVIPVELAANVLEVGRRRWKRAIDAWKRCLDANRWPGYAPSERRVIEFSEYAVSADQYDAISHRERMKGL